MHPSAATPVKFNGIGVIHYPRRVVMLLVGAQSATTIPVHFLADPKVSTDVSLGWNSAALGVMNSGVVLNLDGNVTTPKIAKISF